MKSLESLNQALGVLHHWSSDMSLTGDDESDIDAKIAAACLHVYMTMHAYLLIYMWCDSLSLSYIYIYVHKDICVDTFIHISDKLISMHVCVYVHVYIHKLICLLACLLACYAGTMYMYM